MTNPAWITAAVDDHLRDNPPWDQEISEPLLREVAQEICAKFDYTPIWDSIDQLACMILRERGFGPANETPPASLP
jgi:hypothetical protein